MSNERASLEARIGALISAYAAMAPVDVDPIAMTRRVASGAGHDAARSRAFAWAGGGLAFVLLILALLAAIVAGTLAAGGRPLRSPDPFPRFGDRVVIEPFVGLAPEGAAPSTPERGALVLGFYGRVRSIGLHFHRVRLYADGRLIWVRDQRLPSSAWDPRLTIEQVRKTGVPLGVVEQRLTPAGVELMRQATIGDGLGELGIHDTGDDETRWNLPGVLWGGLELAEGDLVHDKVWADYELPGRLADPAAWLPASAWADERIGAYVPTTYGVCAYAPDDRPSRALDLLPERARKVLERTTAALDLPAGDPLAGRCFQAATDDARAIAAALEEAGLPRELGEHALGYRLDADEELWFLPVLPDGQVVCECG